MLLIVVINIKFIRDFDLVNYLELVKIVPAAAVIQLIQINFIN